MTRMSINRSYSWRQAGFRLTGAVAFLPHIAATVAACSGFVTQLGAAKRRSSAINLKSAGMLRRAKATMAPTVLESGKVSLKAS